MRLLFYIVAAAYPVLVFFCLVVLNIPLRFFALFVILAGILYFLSAAFQKKKEKNSSRPMFTLGGAILLSAGGILGFLTNSPFFLKLYPVLLSLGLLCLFGTTLFSPPSMIFRFALLQDKSIKGSLREGRVQAYCRKVTLIWCGFFILNGGIALITVFSGSSAAWSIYNGGISYTLMGILFAGEFLIRRRVNRNMPRAVPLSRLSPASRPGNAVLCYEGSYEQGIYKTWGDFLDDTAALRSAINAKGNTPWVLHCEDCWYFLAAFTALLQCGREIRLTANISPLYLAEIRRDGAAFITDQEGFEDSLHIPSLLTKAAGEAGIAEGVGTPGGDVPAINADETVILIYTSGTTGTPKAVRQRLREFENDNAFALSKWGEEIIPRKFCSTVSQHHIYGLLFSILLPFTAGVPFRRRRIEHPEEFETLVNDSCMIITVPAFLKRAVEGGSAGAFRLKNPWIFTSGGVLPRQVAEMTGELFGFWPVEIYGSTETSGIAWRRSKDGPEWIPFDDVKIRKNEEGCLVIQSPYIRDPAEFVTGDLVDILEDGRFFLRGRADSIVKIEEKRISLPEVENRLLSSGLLSDVCVIALSGRRQYLAAALVLNVKGKEKFRDCEKRRINRYFREYLEQYFEGVVLPKKWRYLQALPLDRQGKKKKAEVEALFASIPPEEIRKEPAVFLPQGVVLRREVENSSGVVVVELFFPPDCGYFEGHFPSCPLLPGVAQFEIALRTAARYFGTSLYVSRAGRIKFSAPIRPGAVVLLELRHTPDEGILSFKMTESGGGTLYSAGTFILGKVS
ncbi:MAG: AMP-binding protein [Treponema sp.]|jgi:acyl-coenzyme A synthetase/AMP-(fatty) acid ligase/uncharacterized membrane protein/3-hydroxymyristoyl/3-hydroxydecanoyl-(acyl carrier protein) dehydratase|nr:AMP-binding protein [Treponema sp.]